MKIARRRLITHRIVTVLALSFAMRGAALSALHQLEGPKAHIVSVTVRPGDSVWSIAEAHARNDQDIADLVDRIIHGNHLRSGLVSPGMRLRIPTS